MSKTLFKIKSIYIIKSIFSVVSYNHILKLIKNNKKFQTSLGINIQNYKKISSHQYLARKKITIKYPLFGGDGLAQLFKYCCSLILGVILFIYILIFASILAARGAFNENNTKNNYNKNYSKRIDKINLSLFGFLAFIIVSYFILFVWATDDCYYDSILKKIIKTVILIMIGIIFLSYDILIIIKLYLSYKIKKDKITWFMRCDYALIILIFLYLLFIIFVIYWYFVDAGTNRSIINKEKEFILKQFRDIKIKDFKLPTNFKKMHEYEKRKYILNNKRKYEIMISVEQIYLISLINKFRIENNISELIFDDNIKLDDVIIDKYSEYILYDNQSNFKISNSIYLLKYTFEEFKIKFNNKEKDIINILLNDYYNKISTIEKGNILFIFLFHSIFLSLDDINNKRYIERYLEIMEDIPSERIRIGEGHYDIKYWYEDIKYYYH